MQNSDVVGSYSCFLLCLIDYAVFGHYFYF